MPGRTAFYSVLGIAVLGLVLALGQWLITDGMRQELDNLETAYAALSKELKQLHSRQAELAALTDTLAEMGRRVESISASVSELRSGDESPAATSPAPATAGGSVSGPATGTRDLADEATAEAAAVATPTAAVPPAGPWQVNLITLGNREDAAAFAGRARTQGIPAEPETVTVGGKTLWRVRVPGFDNAEAAGAKAREYQAQLGLDGAWVSHR
jgi:cell division septation protein DedD